MQKNLQLHKLTSLEGIDSRMASEIIDMRHADIVRSIERMKNNIDSAKWRSLWISSTYIDSQKKVRPCYILSKKGFLLLASKYDDNLRLQIINRVEFLQDENIRLLKIENERLWDKEDNLKLVTWRKKGY